MNQVQLAASAAVTSALGLVRRFAYVPERDGHPSRDALGVTATTSSLPGARYRKLDLGISGGPHLACFEMDVPHILHVASYCDFVHEAGHLMHMIVMENDPEMAKAIEGSPPEIRSHLSEIFASLVCQLVVFGDDKVSPALHLVGAFSRSLTAIGDPPPSLLLECDTDTVVRFTQLLFRLFMVWDSVPEPKPKTKAATAALCARQATSGKALVRYEAFVRQVGPYFRDYPRLWQGDTKMRVWEYAREDFEDHYSQVAGYMPLLCSKVNTVVDRYRRHSVLPGVAAYPHVASSEAITRHIKSSLDTGTPIERLGLGQPGGPVPAITERELGGAEEPPDECLDPLYLFSELLHEYIGTITKSEGLRVHLVRTPPRGKISYDREGGPRWHSFLYDQGVTPMHCPVPNERRKRLLRQVVVVKTLWDISSSFRARRLRELLVDAHL